jgi:hypothetical protein
LSAKVAAALAVCLTPGGSKMRLRQEMPEPVELSTLQPVGISLIVRSIEARVEALASRAGTDPCAGELPAARETAASEATPIMTGPHARLMARRIVRVLRTSRLPLDSGLDQLGRPSTSPAKQSDSGRLAN